jgi:hypothetical protein
MSSQSKPSAKAADSTDMNSPQQRAKVKQLQELFPSWSNDGMAPVLISCRTSRLTAHHLRATLDLLSLLNEVQGDVDFAATRISEGTLHYLRPLPSRFGTIIRL